MRPVGPEASVGSAERGRSLISTIAVFAVCVVQPKLGLVPGTQSGSVNNDRITCRFQRLRSVAQSPDSQRRRSAPQTDSDVVFSLDAAKYYILMAKGEASRG